MSRNAVLAERIVERAMELVEDIDRRWDALDSKEPYEFESARPDDAQFVAWFEQQRLANPNWLEALPYVDGGREELSRYKRIVVKALRGALAEVEDGDRI